MKYFSTKFHLLQFFAHSMVSRKKYLVSNSWSLRMHSGPENLKKSTPKNSWNQINQFHEKIVWPNFIFCNFQKWPKINFGTGKKFKTAKNAISRKKINLFDFMSFFAWTFLNFLARCALGIDYKFINCYIVNEFSWIRQIQIVLKKNMKSDNYNHAHG